MKLNRVLGLLALSKACIVVKKKKKNAVVFRFHTEALTFDFFILLCHYNSQSYKEKPTSRPKQDARFSAFPDLSLAGVAHGLISFPRAKKLVPKQ